jgi:hypothetical protein
MKITATHLGFAFGIVLGLAGAFGGFSAFIIVLVLGVVGLVAGRFIDGEADPTGILGWQARDRGRR